MESEVLKPNVSYVLSLRELRAILGRQRSHWRVAGGQERRAQGPDDTALLGPRWREALSLKRLKVSSVGGPQGWTG